MTRDYANEGFAVAGGTNFEIAKVGAMAMQKVDVGGRPTPAFKDENGKIHEVRNSRDIEKWMTSNQLGRPRMVEWVNPKTGEKSLTPQRSRMVADPKTGEPMDVGTVIREPERIVPLDKKDFVLPKENRKTGTRFNEKGVATDINTRTKLQPGRKHGKYCSCIPCSMSEPEKPGAGHNGLSSEFFMPSKG